MIQSTLKALGTVAIGLALILAVKVVLTIGTKDHYSYDCTGNTCEVYLGDSIDGQASYENLYKLLETADAGTVVNLHMSGYGGRVDTISRLANVISLSKAEVNTIIEGPVYSAHAVIGMFGKHIKLTPFAFFMFHCPGVYLDDGRILTMEEACSTSKGQFDRGQDAYVKCMQNAEQQEAIFHGIMNAYINKFLTKQEIKDILDGKEVYITSKDMEKRINGHKE